AFPGAVGADQRQDFARAQFEQHAAHGMNAAVGLAEILDRQQCGDHAHSATSTREVACADFFSGDRQRFLIVSSVPTMPLGKATTISTMKPPSTSLERSV